MFVVRIHVENIGTCWLAEDNTIVIQESYAKKFDSEQEANQAAAVWEDMAKVEQCL